MARIRDTALYKNTVQGKDSKFKARLLKELAIVKKASVEGAYDFTYPYLSGAFVWYGTPQGHPFWYHVDENGTFPN